MEKQMAAQEETTLTFKRRVFATNYLCSFLAEWVGSLASLV